jgi:menaquinol-cytochrome c reductase cytochrome b/c subunit
MAEIPESLLRRSAEAKAKALGLPVEQVLAEMKGEAPPTPAPAPAPEPASAPAGLAVEEPAAPDEIVATEEPESIEAGTPDEEPVEAEPDQVPAPAAASEPAAAPEELPEPEKELVSVGAGEAPVAGSLPEAPAAPEAPAPETPPATAGNGSGNGNGRRAALVATRPVVPPAGAPEGVRTQRLLTVVKARAIQQVKTEPTDKVNTWPHLMLAEFSALLAVTGVLVILSIILQAPLLDPANFNATPNPSKAPWYFLGLQELLSYFDPQIAGVTVPTIVGLVGFMAIPYVDRNPSTKPSDRKFAIMLYTLFMAGSATLTIFGVLFRGLGFNFAYPWQDGVFFDDIKDWVHFE